MPESEPEDDRVQRPKWYQRNETERGDRAEGDGGGVRTRKKTIGIPTSTPLRASTEGSNNPKVHGLLKMYLDQMEQQKKKEEKEREAEEEAARAREREEEEKRRRKKEQEEREEDERTYPQESVSSNERVRRRLTKSGWASKPVPASSMKNLCDEAFPIGMGLVFVFVFVFF